jgi:hypothetical protein
MLTLSILDEGKYISTGGLLVLSGIIHPDVSVSTLTWLL